MSTRIYYPYHPVTGERLVGSFEIVPGVYHRDIKQIDGTIDLGDVDGTTMNWDGQITATIQGQSVLVTDSGETCLLNEVHWHPGDAKRIVLALTGQATDISDYNQLASALASLQQRVQLALDSLAQGGTETSKQLLSAAR